MAKSNLGVDHIAILGRLAAFGFHKIFFDLKSITMYVIGLYKGVHAALFRLDILLYSVQDFSVGRGNVLPQGGCVGGKCPRSTRGFDFTTVQVHAT